MKLILTVLLWANIFHIHAQKIDKSQNITHYISSVYQKYISGVRGGSCPMYPSCSNYGLDAFKQGGVIRGFSKTSDRLVRCGHEHSLYDYTYQNGNFKLLDPVDSTKLHELVYRPLKKAFPLSDTIEDNRQYRLVKELIHSELYSEALIELLRFKIDNKAFTEELAANYIIVLSALNKYEEAIFEYDDSFSTSLQSSPYINYEMAKIWNALNLREKELTHLDRVIEKHSRTDLEYQRAVMLKGSALSSMKRYREATKQFESILPSSQYTEHAKQRIQLIKEIETIKLKKPAVGALLGILPGSGYLYANHKQTALSAFILNSLLIYATYSSIKVANYGMASLTGIFAVSFYVSSIVGSHNSVKRYNRKKIENKFAKIDFKY